MNNMEYKVPDFQEIYVTSPIIFAAPSPSDGTKPGTGDSGTTTYASGI